MIVSCLSVLYGIYSFTALHHSALLEKADVCRELLEVEASVDLRDKNGELYLFSGKQIH